MTKKLLKAVFFAILCLEILSVYALASNFAPSWEGEPIYKEILYLNGDEYDYDSIIWTALDQNGKYGIIDSQGALIYPFELDSPPESCFSQIIITKNGKKGIIDTDGNIIVPVEYDSVFTGQTCTANKDGKLYFFKSTNSEMFLVTSYKKLAMELKDGSLFIVMDHENKFGIIDTQGNVIVDFEYDDYYQTFDNHISVSKDGKEGLINYSGEIIFETAYDYIYRFNYEDKSFIQAEINGKYGLYDYSGNVVLSPEYDNHIRQFGDSEYLKVSKNGKSALIRFDGTVVVEYLYNNMFYYSDKYFGIELNGKYGMADYNGNIIIQPIYDDGCIELVDDNTVNIWEFEPEERIIETIDLTTGISVTLSVPFISIPSFSVNINGIAVNNTNALYPCIVYNDITYFPMTYSDSRALGLVADWTAENGLVIEKTGTEPYAQSFEQGDIANESGQVATIVEGKVTVNGKSIDNASEEYPLLLFRDITYFPLTWRFAVEEFGWEYNYTAEAGLVINSK